MYLSMIRVKNYKSFSDSGEINFKSGINIIIGQNNSGKTALLEALSLRPSITPHISIKTRPTEDTPSLSGENSELDVKLVCTGEELRQFIEIQPQEIAIPMPNDGRIDEAVATFNASLQNTFEIQTKASNGGLIQSSQTIGYERNSNTFLLLTKSSSGDYNNYSNSGNGNLDVIWNLTHRFLSRIYRFNAERLNLSICPVGAIEYLVPNASNLPSVLQVLHNTNPARFKELMKYVTEVLPSIKWISAVTDGDNNVEIKVWTIDINTERPDLAYSLKECGTGIGQVLAILYIVIASHSPRTIIIDEPNSFLHPKAAKKLIEILNRFPQHQYFISTHSPEILSAAKPSTITGLQYIDGETVAKSISLEQTKDLRGVLDEVGVRFSDVFFADEILWVEGLTEEKAFPIILESEPTLSGITILPLAHTGDFKSKKQGKKNARLVFDIYKKLTGAHALTPPVVGVILDKDETDQNEMDELKRLSYGLLEFLPRRLFENYLLDAEAIAHVLNQEIKQDDEKVSVKNIEEWIEKKRESKEFLAESFLKQEIKQNEWLENVDGAKLLEKLFSELSDKKVEYRKTTHSVNLTRWLVDNKSEQFAELKKFLLQVLQSNSEV